MYYNDIDLHSFNINLLTRNHKVKSSGLAVYLNIQFMKQWKQIIYKTPILPFLLMGKKLEGEFSRWHFWELFHKKSLQKISTLYSDSICFLFSVPLNFVCEKLPKISLVSYFVFIQTLLVIQ